MSQKMLPWVIVPMLLLLCGCQPAQPQRATIEGEITYQGKPVHYGHIVFIPVEGADGFYSQVQFSDGKYSMSEHGPVVGKNRVEIFGHRKTGIVAPDISGKDLSGETQMIEVTEPYLPSKYNVGSEITVEIESGHNSQVNFHLE